MRKRTAGGIRKRPDQTWPAECNRPLEEVNGRGEKTRDGTKSMWEPRGHVAKMTEFCRNQRLGEGKESSVPGLERFRVGCRVRRAGRSYRYSVRLALGFRLFVET